MPARSMILCIFALSCGGSSAPPVEEGSVSRRGNDVVAPGARILHGGEVGEGSLSAPGDGLVAIEHEGVVYFYHPLVGDAELSEDMSREAVGYFLANLDADGEPAALRVMPDGMTVRSDTGVELSLRVAGDPLQARNTGFRWAALTTDGALAPYYLLPRSAPIPTNVVDAFLSDVNAEGAATDSRSDVRAYSELQIHGAVHRAMPFLVFTGNIESAQQSYRANPELFTTLGLFDLATMLMNGAESLTGLLPSDCADAAVEDSLRAAAMAFYEAVFTDGDPDIDALRQLHKEQLKSAANNWLACAVEATVAVTSVTAALVMEVFDSFLDIVAVANWLVNDALVGTYQAAYGLTAFDEVVIDVPPHPALSDVYPLAAPGRDVEALLSDVYVVTRDALEVVDIETDGTVAPITEVSIVDGRGIDVDGERIFVTASSLNLFALTGMAGAQELERRSSLGFNTDSHEVVVRGDYAWVAAGAYRHDPDVGVFAVGYVEDPTAIDGIDHIGGLELSSPTHDLVVTEDGLHVVLIDEAGTLSVIDVRIPAGPRVVGTLSGQGNDGQPRGLALDGDTLYVANGRLRVVDISNREAPRQLFASPPDGLRDVDLEGGYLYATGGIGEGWLGSFDITNPASPELVSSLRFDHVGNAVDAYSGFAYVATHAGTEGELVVIDLDGSAP